MDTTNPEQPESPDSASHILPKLEDLIAVTGLFTPELIVEELQELEQLDEQQEQTEQNNQP
ncbi:hypothetical protein [Hymenobacter sp. BT190]|uniref:hypothetical protein n=1 Tax=Hymenobacter sp. BT190 TaxID=2763505 RepID=UPI00165193A8|nr:hypothetical protein [Hymenobacter sp. BT190]MBC6698802.1 hypothetical protein [Hymenobacter sp. BT190]